MKLTQWEKDAIDLALSQLADKWGREGEWSKPGYQQLNALREKLGHAGTRTAGWHCEVVAELTPANTPVKLSGIEQDQP